MCSTKSLDCARATDQFSYSSHFVQSADSAVENIPRTVFSVKTLESGSCDSKLGRRKFVRSHDRESIFNTYLFTKMDAGPEV
jgi:hypothetical protein